MERYQIKGNFCTSMDELLRSDDFKRCLGIIARKTKKYKAPYIISIVNKINATDVLTEQEIGDIKNFLEDEDVKAIASTLYNNLQGFTIGEARKFITRYSIGKIYSVIRERVEQIICGNQRAITTPLGNKIRGIREALGLTQKGFAQNCKIPLSSLRKWEQGVSNPNSAAVALLRRIGEPLSIQI